MAFVAGSFAIVLVMLSFVDEEVLLKLELSPGRTVLWNLGLFSAIFVVAVSMIPGVPLGSREKACGALAWTDRTLGRASARARTGSEDTQVYRPDALLRRIIEYTHYYPAAWRSKLHTYETYAEFTELFQLRLKVILAELVGIVLAPFALALAAAPCSEAIVDFVRTCTVKDARAGDVCSFATFDLRRHGSRQARGLPQHARERERYGAPS